MNGLISPLMKLEAFESATKKIKYDKEPTCISGVADSAKSHLMHALGNKNIKLIITYNDIRAKEIEEDMKFFEGEQVMLYPSKDIIFYSADVHSNDIVRERLKVIKRILDGDKITVVISIEALMDPIIHKDIFLENTLSFKVGGTLNIPSLSKQLTYMGYERNDQVDAKGQFSVRGGIIDIYPVNEDNLFRIELFDDEIDSIRLVNPESQRSIENKELIMVLPAREIVVTDESISLAISRIKLDSEEMIRNFSKLGQDEEANRLKKVTNEVLAKVENLGNFNGIEGYMNYYYEELCSIIDYFIDPMVFVDEPVRIKERWDSIKHELEESIKGRFEKGYLLKRQLEVVHDLNAVVTKLETHKRVLMSTLMQKIHFMKWHTPIEFSMKTISPYHNNFEMLKNDLNYFVKNEYQIVLLSASYTRAERMSNLLLENNIQAKFSKSLDEPLKNGIVTVSYGSLHKGFEYPQAKFVVLSETEIGGKKKKKARQKKFKEGRKLDSFTDLKVGDYIVHENHGIGVFRGIEKIEIDGISKDFIKISYQDGGNLYITTNQLNAIQKYIGVEGKKPKLNKLGTNEWKKTKARVKSEVEVLAKDLIELYAKREIGKGFIYSKDTLWQREFEEMFPYDETDDQISAIEDTKRDMESNKIMDRLICGDVGYGKTEVAIRAAFKAVQDGKQVAYLVPTTILAQQHFNNFLQRMKDFPVRVEMLSRFKSPKDQKVIIEDLNKGLVDIVIGTHRIISMDVKFKNLGLLIVDEEQRFGVSHKEKIKKLKENIDVLTLTATPIPRTLHMSMVGIRDMSTLEEPPEERHPIQTYVLEHNEQLIKDAIYREIGRNGQVYYVYNRVKNIDEIAHHISMLVPEAKVAYAHGQMSERELENMMVEFINGEIDVLVSTTIIETGLDIQNVNTIIIQDADRMGLSQLYQLRGRVGRSNRVAYAYLMYKKDKVLQEVAEKRLQAIKQFTEFGSGFKIAMRDLEIRGAGNILGEKQHGHLDAVGYDLYCRLLEQALHKMSDHPDKEKIETTINIDVDAYIPKKYIKDEIRKIEAYKKIASIEKEEDYMDVHDELTDRYGELPRVVVNLLEIALIKALANELDMMSVEQKGEEYIFEISKDATLNPEKIPELVKEYGKKLKFTVNEKICFILSVKKDEKKQVFRQIKNLLQRIKSLND
ncbi:MAG: transcription-repair coupling factor [Firmicutes bacterium HGW-Firmicutes-1]|jgi:transcription-repair coupling factor (superfamily II helicase)|nr:MAG: transcription-repair coupling factor [Firmicutes bacterium HGW-Firmicutes-1]